MDSFQIAKANNAASNGRLIVVLTFAIMIYALWGRVDLPNWPLVLPLLSITFAWAADYLNESRFLPFLAIVSAVASVVAAVFLLIGV